MSDKDQTPMHSNEEDHSNEIIASGPAPTDIETIDTTHDFIDNGQNDLTDVDDLAQESSPSSLVDDYDDDFLFEDNVFDDHHSDEDMIDPFDDDNSSGEKTGLNWTNIILIGGASLALVAGGYFVFLAPSNTPSTANLQPYQPSITAQESVGQDEIVASAVEKDLQTQIIDQGGILGNLDLLKDTNNQENLEQQDVDKGAVFSVFEQQDTPSTPEEDLDAVFGKSDQNNDETNTQTTDLAPLPQAMDNSLPVNNDVNTLPILADNVTPPSFDTDIPAIDDVVTTNISPDTINMDDIDAALNTLSQQDEDLSIEDNQTPIDKVNIVESDPSPLPSQSDDTLQAMQSQLDDALQTIETMQTDHESALNNLRDQKNREMQNSILALENKIKSLETKVATQNKKTTRPIVKKYRPVVKSAPAKPSISWSLRGASPGKALIARTGTDNLQTVTVGETIASVGKVTSIAVENGRWVVRGTTGTIKQ